MSCGFKAYFWKEYFLSLRNYMTKRNLVETFLHLMLWETQLNKSYVSIIFVQKKENHRFFKMYKWIFFEIRFGLLLCFVESYFLVENYFSQRLLTFLPFFFLCCEKWIVLIVRIHAITFFCFLKAIIMKHGQIFHIYKNKNIWSNIFSLELFMWKGRFPVGPFLVFSHS